MITTCARTIQGICRIASECAIRTCVRRAHAWRRCSAKHRRPGGMTRFLVVHFPVVVNKVLPEGSLPEIESLLEDTNYFNDISCEK